MTSEEFHEECPQMKTASIRQCVRMLYSDEELFGEIVWMGKTELALRGLLADD